MYPSRIMRLGEFKQITANKIWSELRDLRQCLTFAVRQEVVQFLSIELNGIRG
jgi:hypothetical protein